MSLAKLRWSLYSNQTISSNEENEEEHETDQIGTESVSIDSDWFFWLGLYILLQHSLSELVILENIIVFHKSDEDHEWLVLFTETLNVLFNLLV